MRLINTKTLDIISDGDFYRLFPYTSFPSTLTDDVVDGFGYAVIFETTLPAVGEYQYLHFDGAIKEEGKWKAQYVIVELSNEEKQARLEQWRATASCTPFQGRMALSDAGLLASVEAAVAHGDEKTKVAWEYAILWERVSPMIETLMTALNISATQADDLFKAAQHISA